MPRRKQKAPNDFCDTKADDIPASTSSSTLASTATTTLMSKPESSNATPMSNRNSSQFNSKPNKPGAKPPLTHFLCIPLVTPTSRHQLQEALERFKEDVCMTANIPEKAIRPVGTLHLTLGVMSLDDEALERAVSMLRDLDLANLLKVSGDSESTTDIKAKQNIQSSETSAQTDAAAPPPPSQPQPLTISLQGLHSMHPPARTSILYAAPHDPTSRLYPAANYLRTLFMQNGLLVPDDRPLKLHATIVNTIYAKSGRGGRGAGHGPYAKALLRLDAKDMMERYADFVWCEGVRVERVAICRMGAKQVVDAAGMVVGEEYEEIAKVEV